MADFKALFIAPYHELADEATEVALDYPSLGVTVREGDLSAGLAAALGSFDADFDVVISRGGTAQLIEEEFTVPVIEIAVSPTDLYEALARYNPGGKRTAVVGFANAIETLMPLADFADFDLDVFGISFEDELPLVLEDVRRGSYEVVLCDTFSEGRFVSEGVDAHLLASGRESVERAFDQALRFCQQTREISATNHMLWQLVRSLDSKFAIFSAAGKLMYSNLEDDRDALVDFMREHLEGEGDERLSLRHGRRAHHINKTHVQYLGERSVAFCVSTSKVPSGESLVGMTRRNRDEVDQEYHESIFHEANGGEELAPLIAVAARSGRPVMIEGELGTGKTQIAYLLYLSGSWCSRPFVMVDCSLLIDKSWEYLIDSSRSPLYGSDETLYLKSIHALDPSRLRRLVDLMGRTGICQRDHVIVSANDSTAAGAREASNLVVQNLHCHVLSVPPLRARRNLRQAIGLFLTSEARRQGTEPLIVTDEAMDLLLVHDWVQNYIEFRQVLQRASATSGGGCIRASDVRDAIARVGAVRFSSLVSPNDSSTIDLLRPLRDTERDIVRMVVDKYDGNQTEASRTLGLSRTTVWRILRE